MEIVSVVVLIFLILLTGPTAREWNESDQITNESEVQNG